MKVTIETFEYKDGLSAYHNDKSESKLVKTEIIVTNHAASVIRDKEKELGEFEYLNYHIEGEKKS